MKKIKNDPEMLEEYDFRGGVRGKYSKRYAEGTNVVVIDPDLAEYFPDHDAVNDALRSLAAIIRRKKIRTTSCKGSSADILMGFEEIKAKALQLNPEARANLSREPIAWNRGMRPK